MRLKRIYICSPYKGDVIMNVARAKKYSQEVYKQGNLPLCVHIYLNEATGLSEDKGDREKLLELGREFVRISDEVWVYGKCSEGMIQEIHYAKSLKLPIKYFRGEEDYNQIQKEVHQNGKS